MRLLDGYIIRAILGPVAFWMSVFLVLGGLFIFIGQQDDIGVGNYSALDAIVFVLLNLPEQAWALLPVSALIGSLMGLGSLARGSEITVIRATGVSTSPSGMKKRQKTSPKPRPSVSIQLGTPGSSCAMTMR